MKPTRIMYASNLSWRLLQEQLAELENLGLVKELDAKDVIGRDGRTSIMWQTTSKGIDFLKKIDAVEGVLGE